jgi:hypothetical protein
MAGAAEMIRPRLEDLTVPGAGSRVLQVIQLGIAMALVAAVYLAAAWIFRIPESTRTLAAVDRRLQRLTRRSR